MKRKASGSARGTQPTDKRFAREKDLTSSTSYNPANESLEEDDEGSNSGFEDLEAENATETGLSGGSYGEEEDGSEMEGGFVDLEAEEEDNAEGDDVVEGEQGDSIGANADDAEAGATTNATGKSKRISSLYAIPTNEEMQGLRETSELFKNNVIKLQIEELLQEVRPSYERAGALELVLRRLHLLLSGLPSIEQQALPTAIEAAQKLFKSFSSISIPFADPAPRTDGKTQHKFGFAPPEGLHLVGSWPLKSATKRPEGMDVDVAVIMPSRLFQEKDHLNLRYAHKRAFFLAVLASAIRDASQPSSTRKVEKAGESSEAGLPIGLSWELLDADPRRPILVLTPTHGKTDADFSKLKVRIRIHPAYDPASIPFNFSRLAPSRNSIRVNVAASSTDAMEDVDDIDHLSVSSATAIYNTTVLMDGLALAHLVYLHKTAQACPSFQDACSLLKTWAFQRGFGSGAGRRRKDTKNAARDYRYMLVGSGSARFILTMILAHLLHGEAKKGTTTERAKLSNGLSSYQLFRGVLDWLSKHDFAASPVAMKHIEGIPSMQAKIPADDFRRHFECVLVDPTGCINLLASLPVGNINKLQYEAKRTLTLMDDGEGDNFGTVFLSDLSAPYFSFDEVVQVAHGAIQKLALVEGDGAKVLQALARADIGGRSASACKEMVSNLRRGLADRANVVAVLANADEASGLVRLSEFEKAVAPSSQNIIGISYNIENALRIVDHGPAPTDAEVAASYRKFWGDVAELRRFKDGRVLESIVWKSTAATRRWTVPRQVVQHVLARHHGISSKDIVFFGASFDGLLDVDRNLSLKAFLSSPQEKGFQLVQAAFADYCRALRSTDMPLSLSSIVPTSSALRGMSTFVPGPLNVNGLGTKVPDVASYLPAQQVVLTFESSGRWPDDLAAIQPMKAAFFERLATSIADKVQGSLARVLFDAQAPDLADCCALEVIMPTGFAFQARIHHDRERVLLRRILDDKLGETPKRKNLARSALALHDRRFTHASRHHIAMNILTHKFAALSETVRLAKRWVAAQMVGSHVPEESVELLCASIFLSLGDAAPASGPSGYVLFLHKLASWAWREEPVAVPLFTASQAPEETKSAAFPEHISRQVSQAFQRTRSSDPSLSQRAWFIATEQDVQGSCWSESRPSVMIADALRQLARSSIEILKTPAAIPAIREKILFTPPTATYDFQIHLQPHLLPRYSESLVYTEAKWDPSVASHEYRNLSAANQRSSILGHEPRPGFDSLTAFAQLLEHLYGDSFKVFYDPHGGTTIAGLWNPALSNERPHKVALGFSSEPVMKADAQKEAKAKSIRINQAAILAEVERLGKDLIVKIERK
ncbi:Nrap protein [Tilletiaria anomala UBC 951]|uniref:Nrap protein n=1 Tax=Tilletiaria anomala (strain ATCC 24038 / CBS 436.72 / UBC 951) TaxID=1037660 RepID=A0A066V6E3_TILAU|nr:Nrap protein [Tilletiaria anomala UBC 951]KDN37312.1 Nrap protein [Tilletiaria anomala UBC 951]